MAKKRVKEKPYAVTLHIHGIFDNKNKKIVFVSLDLADTEMELALMDDHFCRCEFQTTLFL